MYGPAISKNDWVDKDGFIARTGLDEKFVREFVAFRWTEGVEFKHDNDRLLISPSAWERWFEEEKRRGIALEEKRAEERAERARRRGTVTELYRHFDCEGNLLYVGISLSTASRAAGHKSQSHWWPEVTRIEIERHPTKGDAEKAERAAIKSEKPIHNRAHSDVAE